MIKVQEVHPVDVPKMYKKQFDVIPRIFLVDGLPDEMFKGISTAKDWETGLKIPQYGDPPDPSNPKLRLRNIDIRPVVGRPGSYNITCEYFMAE